MPFAENLSAEAAAQGRAMSLSVAKKVRYGLMAARINSSQRHRLGIDAMGRKAGSLVYIDVKDGTRYPAEGEQASWVCYNPHCAGKRWETKRELQAAHPEQRQLQQQQEVHVYVAVCELPATKAQPEQLKDGKVVREAQPDRPAVVMLLSDEE